MNRDDSGRMNLYLFPNTPMYDTRIMYPDWSIKDKIIFEVAYVDESGNKCNSKLFVIRSNGGLYDKIEWPGIEQNLSYPTWSPDGNYFAFNYDGHILKSSYPLQGMPVKLDESFDFAAMPSWSPSGDRIAFLGIPNNSTSGPNIYTVDINSLNLLQITRGNYWDKYPSWSPDGDYIAFSSDRDNGNKNIWKVKSDGSMEGLEQLTNGLTDILPKYSPGGDKLLYSSKRIGRWGIYSADLKK
jgi:Tol biopolymer transport system component